MGNRIIRSIRILPSDKTTFETEMEFRAFIQGTMPLRGGYYYFPNQMMNCPDNTFVLFQYDGMIRATGVLVDREKTTVIDERGAKYGGYYLFDMLTLHYLANPIDKNLFKQVYPEFIGFNQTKQIISLRYWDSIFSLLQNIDSFYTEESQSLVPEIEEEMFVFKDMEDYQKNGKNVDAKYNAGHKVKVSKKSPGKSVQKVRHKKFGEGTVVERKGEFIVVNFVSVGRKQLNLQLCLDKGLMEFV